MAILTMIPIKMERHRDPPTVILVSRKLGVGFLESAPGGWVRVSMGYSTERKQAVLRKLLPPYNRTVADLAKEEGVSTAPTARLSVGVP